MREGTRESGRGRTFVVRLIQVLTGILTVWMLVFLVRNFGEPVKLKLLGKADPDCTWRKVLEIPAQEKSHFNRRHKIYAAIFRIAQEGEIEQYRTPLRPFWIKGDGDWRGEFLLTYLLADHEILVGQNLIQQGDIVLDCGAHIGVFTERALALGAAKVVAIEPDPTNQECLRRNFTQEIADGLVIAYPKGVWSSEGRLTLRESTRNSGASSVVVPEEGRAIEIAVTTIDRLVSEMRLPKVDVIKMDIEGAERDALEGASETLRKYRPRLMLDSYHRPDDMEAFRAVIRRAVPSYQYECGPCEVYGGNVLPHVTFWNAGQ
jgi:FkbM family methyltransferase